MKYILVLTALVAAITLSCKTKSGTQNDKDITFTIENPSGTKLSDHAITITNKALIAKVDSVFGKNFAIYDEEICKSEAIDFKNDGIIDAIILICNLNPGEVNVFKIREVEKVEALAKKTQAEISIKEGGEWKIVTKKNGAQQYEYVGGDWKNIDYLKVPEQHTDHSFYIRYEGPGWESDKVGYRFYLDWRNANDIYGKKVDTVVLQGVGLDNFDSYHEMQDWGVDILKVGNSLGIGSIAYWMDGKANRVAETDSIVAKIILNGNLESGIKTKYYGWQVGNKKTNLKSKLYIDAGSRLTKEEITLDPAIDNICTGIVKHDKGELLLPEGITDGWSYIATYGQQTLQDNNLGMVVFYNMINFKEVTNDEFSHVVVLTPEDNMLTYYFAAAWELESGGIKTKEDFISYLNQTVDVLNNPVKVTF